MAAPTAGGAQLEMDKQLKLTPVQPPPVPPKAAVPATATVPVVAIDSVLPALSDRRSSTPLTPSAHAVPKQAPPNVPTPTTAASRPAAQAATGQPPTRPATTRNATPRQVALQNPALQRVSLPSEAGGHPNGAGVVPPLSSLFKDVMVPGKTRPPANPGTVTPIQTPHALPTPPVSTISIPASLSSKPTTTLPAKLPATLPTTLSPKPTVIGVPTPAPTASPTPVSFVETGSALPISSLLTSPAPQSADDSHAGLRPAYKMKRTGRPGMLPPSAMHPNGSRTPTPSGSTPTRTPTETSPTPFQGNFGIKTQPPPQPQSKIFTQTSHKPALIESDLLPKTLNSPSRPTRPQHTTASTNGPPNGIKRRRESVVDLAQPAQKRTKAIRSSSSLADVAEAPVTLAISLSSGPDDSSDSSDSDNSTDSPDSSDGDIEDHTDPTNAVLIEEDNNDSNSLNDSADSDDSSSDIDSSSDNDEATGSVEVGDDEAEALLASASPESYAFARSGRAYNKYQEDNGELTSTRGAIIPDGYKLWPDRITPWICPVRSCRRLFPELISMGGHFSRGHRASNLNDNLDGTLTVVKRLTSTSERIGARVVSQKAPSKPEPLAKPRVSQPVKKVAAVKAALLAGFDRPKNKTRSHKAKPSKGSPPTRELLVSASGREYAKFFDGSLGHGILFPDGYVKSSYPKLPWVCPVRDCQRVLSAIHNLGSHFTQKHRRTLFNDNGDGTLSKVGTHNQRRAFIVSTVRRPASELEPLAPQMPAGYRPKTETVAPPAVPQETAKLELPGAAPAPKPLIGIDAPLPGPDDFAQPLPADRQATWDYVQPFLSPTLRGPTPPNSGYGSLFLSAPRVRNIKWNERRKLTAPAGGLSAMRITAALIQLSGDYVPKPCDHCSSGQGLFEGCVITSSKGNADMNVAYAKCANCVERRNETCSLQHIFRLRFAKLFPHLNYDTTYRYARSGNFGYAEQAALGLYRVVADRVGVVRRERGHAAQNGGGTGATSGIGGGGGGGGGAENGPNPASSGNEPLARGALRRGLDTPPKRQVSHQHEQHEQHQHQHDQLLDIHDRRRSGRIADQGVIPLPLPKQTSSSMALARTHTASSDSPLVFAGNVQPGPEALEMEDWEVAPGRVQTSDNENIAFSNAYLTSNQMVPIDHNLSYHVKVVRSGSSVSFVADDLATRICMLAAGKLRVVVGDDARFVMGPNGMFKVKPGTSFAVENRLYIDAYLHISALHYAA